MTTDLRNPFDYLDPAARQAFWDAKHYVPQAYQQNFHDLKGYIKKFVTGGTGAGKTYTITMDYVHEPAAAHMRVLQGFGAADGASGRWGIVGPSYKQPRVVMNYLYEIYQAMGIIAYWSDPKDREWVLKTVNGCEFRTISAAAGSGAISAEPYTGFHLTEAMQLPDDVYDAAMERTQRWPGPHPGKLYVEGTFEPKDDEPQFDWFVEQCQLAALMNDELAVHAKFPSWLNEYNYPDGFNGQKIQALFKHYKNQGKEHIFQVRIGGELPKRTGYLWADYFNKEYHVSDEAEFDPNIPVDFTFDPATHRYAGLWLQWPDDKTLYVVDQQVMYQADFNKYKKDWLASRCHKALARGESLVTCDVAATQKHQGQPSTTHELWSKPVPHGCGWTPKYQYLRVEKGFQLLVNAFNGEYYRIVIHPRCTELLLDLARMKRNKLGQIDENINRGVDDCVKALWYYLNIKRGYGLPKKPRKKSKLAIGSTHGLMAGV